MRVLVAPDAVRDADDTCSALDAAAALADGWASARPSDTIVVHPMSTGADGLVDAMRARLGGEQEAALARDARGVAVPTSWWRAGSTGYLEAAHLLGSPDDDDAAGLAEHGGSAGVGDLVAAAIGAGVTRVVVGVGVVAVHDAGVGALRALAGADAAVPLPEVVAAARAAVAGVEVVVATATEIPLLGLSGAGAATAGRPGIDATLAQRLERGIAGAVAQIEAAAVVPRSLLVGLHEAPARRLSRSPGSGAGGGLGLALAAIGGRLLPGAGVVAVETGLAHAIADVDLVLTACSVLDGAAVASGVPGAVGGAALSALVPVVAVAPSVLTSRRDLSGSGVEAVYPLLDPVAAGAVVPPTPLSAALSQRASRVARTWSR